MMSSFVFSFISCCDLAFHGVGVDLNDKQRVNFSISMCYGMSADCESNCNPRLHGSCAYHEDTKMFCCEYKGKVNWWIFPVIVGISVAICLVVLIVLCASRRRLNGVS